MYIHILYYHAVHPSTHSPGTRLHRDASRVSKRLPHPKGIYRLRTTRPMLSSTNKKRHLETSAATTCSSRLTGRITRSGNINHIRLILKSNRGFERFLGGKSVSVKTRFQQLVIIGVVIMIMIGSPKRCHKKKNANIKFIVSSFKYRYK